jgi:hypothetical protein
MSIRHLAVGALLLTPLAFSAEPPKTCESAKEFITALEFLRGDADFRIPEAEARELSVKIADGCTGAARRFIRVSKALNGAGADRKDSTRFGLQFAGAREVEADAFLTVFRSALASDGLDLTLSDSLKLALSLATEFKGDLERARKDFESLSIYCVDPGRVGVSRMRCADLVAKVVRSSADWTSSAAREWIEAYEFLRSPRGPALVTAEAVGVAENLVSIGPAGFRNFQQSYLYALSDSGLKLPRNEAISFALRLARIQPKTEEPEKAREQKKSRSAPGGA